MFADKMNISLNVIRLCELLGWNGSTFYNTPKPVCAFNLELKRQMDEHYLLHPKKGAPGCIPG